MFETEYTAGGRLDPPHYPTYSVPFVVGLKETASASAYTTLEYTVPFIGELYAISIDASAYQNNDNWSLKVDDELICDQIYVKRAPEGINMMAFIPVIPGTKISIKFINSGSEKVVWCSLHFLRNGDLSKNLAPLPPGGMSPIKVNVPIIRLYLIDDGQEDGDALSIYLNGAKIKDNMVLKNDVPRPGVNGVNYIEVPLAPGDNEFIFEGECTGKPGSALTAKFRVTDVNGNVLYDIPELPSLTMPEGPVDSNQHYLPPKPRVRWVVNRTV